MTLEELNEWEAEILKTQLKPQSYPVAVEVAEYIRVMQTVLLDRYRELFRLARVGLEFELGRGSGNDPVARNAAGSLNVGQGVDDQS